jgi:hypothetical protein
MDKMNTDLRFMPLSMIDNAPALLVVDLDTGAVVSRNIALVPLPDDWEGIPKSQLIEYSKVTGIPLGISYGLD